MSWTKREFIEQAYDEIGLASYVYNLTAEQLQSALRRMDSMLAQWNAKGIRISYPLPGSPSESSLDSATNVPDSANEAIYTNLAIKIAPSHGKVVSQETKNTARESYTTLLSRATNPATMQLPGTMPSGAGNNRWRTGYDIFLQKPIDYIATGPDGVLDFY